MKRAAFVAAAIVAGFLGTSSSACRRAAEPVRTVAVAPAERHVEAGTKFSGTLNAELSTLRSREGDRFTITVEEPVLANDGTTAFHRGDVLHGRVLRVERDEDESPRLTIAIDGVNAAIIDANGYATVGLADPSKPHDSVFTPPIGPKAAFGGGPRSYEGDNALAPRYHLTIPSGTRVTMLVTEPTVR